MRNLKEEAEALYSLNPLASWHQDAIDGSLSWLSDDITQPTQTEIDSEVIRLQAEYDALAWKRSREAEYPSLLELTVALYDTDDKSAVEAKRAAVKAKFPKP